MNKDLAQVVVTEEEIRRRIAELGGQLTELYRQIGAEEVTAICITNGSIMFAADLLRQLDLHVRMDCVRVSSYKDEDRPVTEPEIIDQIRLDLTQQHVLLIDDILDTGRTLDKVTRILRAQKPASLHTCVLLNKKRRKQVRVTPDFVGFTIPDHFVVGYGLDFAERYRNLPCIGVLRPELQNPPNWCAARKEDQPSSRR
jgi:hypoxanthine phosphoribosyltransferase